MIEALATHGVNSDKRANYTFSDRESVFYHLEAELNEDEDALFILRWFNSEGELDKFEAKSGESNAIGENLKDSVVIYREGIEKLFIVLADALGVKHDPV